ncbi:hypothetical protein [Kitasatospora sp. NPDC058046]
MTTSLPNGVPARAMCRLISMAGVPWRCSRTMAATIARFSPR